MLDSSTPEIFLSYRRADAGGYAGRLASELEMRFGRNAVFHDVATIAPGSDFGHAIDAAITQCKVVVVLIGDTWLSERDDRGGLRLDDPADYVRLEVAAALRAGRPILPVLVEQAPMPERNRLPEDLAGLARLQALELSDSRWAYDVERVADAIRRLATRSPGKRRRWVTVLVAGAGAIGAAGLAAYVVLGRPADVSGRWSLPNGSFWVIEQQGQALRIEETHYDSKQVWKRGAGTIDRDRVVVTLDLVFQKEPRFEGTLALSSDGKSLTGEMRDSNGRKELLTLTRRQ